MENEDDVWTMFAPIGRRPPVLTKSGKRIRLCPNCDIVIAEKDKTFFCDQCRWEYGRSHSEPY